MLSQHSPLSQYSPTASRLPFKLAVIALPIAMIVIALGAYTRLVDAGLGCPDWPGCYGHLLWPNEAHEIALAEARFPETPVEASKTWPEMVHRYTAGLLGLVVLLLTALTFRNHRLKLPHAPLKLSVVLLCMIIAQALFGMWTVTLKLWPKVVTIHLLGGFTTLSLIWLLALRANNARWKLSQTQALSLFSLKPLLWLVFLTLIVQIALGGWVSANYAALACPDFPLCFGQWLPPTNFRDAFAAWQNIGPNYLGGQLDNHARTAIHLTHRAGAVMVTVTMLTAIILLLRIHHAGIRVAAITLGVLLTLQIGLGISNIIFAHPLWLAVAHNAVAALLLLNLIFLLHQIYSSKTSTERLRPSFSSLKNKPVAQ